MSIIFNSFLLVAVTEMGDKTQLLAFVLASRFKKPWTVLAGIFVATIMNHLLAAGAGVWISSHVPGLYIKWSLAFLFFIFAGWILMPDNDGEEKTHNHFGPFLTTVISFFLAEMGDKTQLATVALAAEYQNMFLVTIGSTLGMLLADGLAVFFGKRITQIIPMKWIRLSAALLYVIFGILLILN